jgi:thymidylate kinase
MTHDNDNWPRCLHLAGVDGTGKTTQAKAILSLFQQQGLAARLVWLRFPRLFCTPLLVYARLRGYSRQEIVNGHRHGYWDFTDSWLMSKVFPWVLLVDTFLMALFKIYLPLWLGRTLVCDRFVVDILVDLMVGLRDEHFDQRLPGRLFLALLPEDTQIVILDLDTRTARQRSRELEGDRSHPRRRAMYLDMASRRGWAVVSTDRSVAETTRLLAELIVGDDSAPQRGKEPGTVQPAPHQRS